MVVERITRGEKWFDICYGYGRLLKARRVLADIPESIRRVLLVNPDATGEELLAKALPTDILDFNARTGREIAIIVLHHASDWDKGKIGVEEYVDGSLPIDVGEEILDRVQKAVADSFPSQESKKRLD